MNIYIYGSSGFKKQMQNALGLSHVKIRLDAQDSITEIDKLEDLKSTIALNPNDIYLIDQEKIIDDNGGIGSKIGFLKPKDAIEKSYLQSNGINDLQFKSIDEVGKQINAKLDKLKHEMELIQQSSNTQEEMSQNDDLEAFTPEEANDLIWSDSESIDIEKFRESLSSIEELDPEIFGSRNNDFELDDDLSGLLMPDDETKEDEISNTISQENENFDEPFGDIDLDEIYGKENEAENEEKFDNFQPTKNQPEDNMMFDNTNMFDGLDAISQDEMARAFDGVASIDTGLKFEPSIMTQTSNNAISETKLEGVLADEISSLIKQLLKNKTIEITIKIKE